LLLSAESPTFIENPQKEIKVAVGQSVSFVCHVFGAPKPTITWEKKISGGVKELVTGSRFIQENNGNLRITVCYFRSSNSTRFNHTTTSVRWSVHNFAKTRKAQVAKVKSCSRQIASQRFFRYANLGRPPYGW